MNNNQSKQKSYWQSLWQCICVGLLLSALSQLSGAQTGTTGSLSGVIQDVSGAAVAGAKVTASNAATGFSRTVAADAEGRWQFVVLPVGDYKVSFEANGFKKAVASVAVEASVPRVLDAKLEVGEVSVQVEITDTAPLLTANYGYDFSPVKRGRVNQSADFDAQLYALAVCRSGR